MESLFENKRQYRDMMIPLVRIGIFEENELPTLIDPVRKALKRNDRIVWYLKYLRISVLYQNRENIDDFDNIFRKITGENFVPYSQELMDFRRWFMLSTQSSRHIRGLFDLIPEINQLVWSGTPNELYNEIAGIEEEWKESRKQEVVVQPDDRIIIDYGERAWVLLDRGFCRAEGDAMGHCGNVEAHPGDRILSFRTKVNDMRQKPHLTFILDSDGFLGEMKGRANEKPSSKYHPYIIDLLKRDFIKGIKGGGYAPEYNFSMDDLDENTRKQLIELKPELGGIKELFIHEGMTDRVERLIDHRASELGLDWYFYDSKREMFAINLNYDIERIGREYGFSALAYAGKVYSGEEFIDVSSDWVRELLNDSDRVDELFKALPEETKDKIVKYYTDEGYDDLDEAMEELEDLKDAFRSAFYSGVDTGTQAEIMNDVDDWLREHNFVFYEGSDLEKYNHITNVKKSGAYFHLINSNAFFKGLDDGYEMWDEIDSISITDLDPPSYGWEGWDETAAVERLIDEINENIR